MPGTRPGMTGTLSKEHAMNENIMNVDYSTKIPNNVNLSEDRQVLKALEGWHPGYMNWWSDMGPEGFQQSLVYLRTAYSVDPRGWAKFDYVRMPEYRWGILLAPQEENRVIPFGLHFGEPAWQEVPGEYRAALRRLIVIQAIPSRHPSSSSAISARPRPGCTICATCSRSTSR